MNVCQCTQLYKTINIKGLFLLNKKLIFDQISKNKRNLATVSKLTNNIEASKKQKNIPNKKWQVGFPADGPNLDYFMDKWSSRAQNVKLDQLTRINYKYLSHPYISLDDVNGYGRKVFFKVYGCQMNVSDGDVAWAILKKHGYELASSETDADVVLLVTCSIRENAEQKIWNELYKLSQMKTRKNINLKIGILGCMAERLKVDIIDKQKKVDVVVGPDSYKDLPRLLAITYEGDKAVNVLLSHEETCADVTPVMIAPNNASACVSIMRGCDNMCTYCIVPFTRGKERSRDVDSIINEIRHLHDSGIKQVTLLGQNVNSYNDRSTATNYSVPVNVASGFTTIYKSKQAGLRFAELLDKVSLISKELRIRFTSPHPKDFPDEVLQIMSERHNICNNLHLPAQSGNSRILEKMRRGYTRESYLELVSHIRSKLPTVTLTSDFICGFCSETDQEFEDTFSLVDQVDYSFIYAFPYSLREKTVAHRKYVDDVSLDVKNNRVIRLLELFRKKALKNNLKEVGKRHIILVEGLTRRAQQSGDQLEGRNEFNIKVLIPNIKTIIAGSDEKRLPQPSDYVQVLITEATSQTLKGSPQCITTMADYYKL